MVANTAEAVRKTKADGSMEEAVYIRPERSAVAQAVSVAIIASLAPGPLLAQSGGLEEVIVTATKREESLMDVPLAITAMSGDFIREVNLNDIKDLIQFTPGISGNSKDSFLDFVSVRGIRTIDFGNGGDPSVSLYKNGLYQGRTGSAVSSMYDIERAEVLRGPQGFLFGRNSVSGAFNVITAKPDLDGFGGYAEVDVGERGVFVFEGALNTPISDTFGLRIAGYHSEEDGYVKNLAGGPDLIGHEKQAVRVSARYDNDRLTTDLFVEYEDRDQTGTVYRVTGGGFTQPGLGVDGHIACDVRNALFCIHSGAYVLVFYPPLQDLRRGIEDIAGSRHFGERRIDLTNPIFPLCNSGQDFRTREFGHVKWLDIRAGRNFIRSREIGVFRAPPGNRKPNAFRRPADFHCALRCIGAEVSFAHGVQTEVQAPFGELADLVRVE